MDLDLTQDIAVFENIAAVPTILDVICSTTGMGFAAIARVTEDSWIACQVVDHIDFGLNPGGELKVESTLCHEVRQQRQLVVINHVAEDAHYRDHHTPQLYGFQSYISMPITLADGSFFGTLCAIDPRPARVNTPEVIGMFKLFAELLAFHLDSQRRLARSEASLAAERADAKRREAVIAVLGHELRNPLAAIKAGTTSLLKSSKEERTLGISQLMHNSAMRMEGLISNVLDFARGRFGSGLELERENKSIEPTLVQVLDEIRLSTPGRTFETRFQLADPVDCDHAKIAQLLSNLVSNAVTHGAKGQPIRITATTTSDTFGFAVLNAGEAIPDSVREHLFQPFYRGQGSDGLHGLGLGLYISAQIAKAHGGVLEVSSTAEQTRFTFHMPRLAPQVTSA